MSHRIAAIPGDGIGKEVVPEGLRVIEAAARRFDLLRSGYLWLGGALAAILFAPHLVWQQFHGWPTREFVAHAQAGKITQLEPWQFVAAQFELIGPVAGVLALAGLGWLLLARSARPFRTLGWAVLVVLVILQAPRPTITAAAAALTAAGGARLGG